MNFCANCMWGDKCSAPDGCEYYDPLDDTHLEITYNRTAFEKEWADYIYERSLEGGDWNNY